MGQVKRSVVYARPAVWLSPSYLFNQLSHDYYFCVCMCHDHSLPGIESQGHRSRSSRLNHINPNYVICCELARRGVRRGTDGRTDSDASGRGNAVGLTSILIDGGFSSWGFLPASERVRGPHTYIARLLVCACPPRPWNANDVVNRIIQPRPNLINSAILLSRPPSKYNLD